LHWVIPADYPTGSLLYKVVATDLERSHADLGAVQARADAAHRDCGRAHDEAVARERTRSSAAPHRAARPYNPGAAAVTKVVRRRAFRRARHLSLAVGSIVSAYMELELSHRARAAHLQHGRRVADVFLTSPRSSSRETSSGTKGIFVVMVRAP
jgi:hypothetical protein